MSSTHTRNTWMLTTRLPHDLADQLRELAKRRNRAVSHIVTEAIAETVKKETSEHTAERAA
jgi:predicted transcriptional regulator